ncbi:MAG: ATP-binding cassette domain-containing protein [Proteobacteria bacterium]|nr:ATP-binding cassette domain-containing protein [Pseudomonadota bacterium]
MIEVEHLTKRYGTTLAVDDLSFSVERGEIVGFLGPNGAGKSTTMRILCGSLGATGGRAMVDGIDVMDDPRGAKRKIGYLPEAPPLYTEMTVRQYLRFCGKIKGADKPRDAAEVAIEKVGLTPVAHRIIGNLSKGYRQRVGIAQALVHSPDVLVLDEPNSGLDPAQRAEIRTLIEELAAGDTTVILSTHVLPEIEALCDRVVIIHQGRIVAQNTVDALGGDARVVKVTVDEPSPELAARFEAIAGVTAVKARGDGLYLIEGSTDLRREVAKVAVDAGLLELSGQRQLEDVFLQLTGGAE